MIAYYEYFIAIIGSYDLFFFFFFFETDDHFILLGLSNIFIFMKLLLSICLCFYKNILN